MYCCRQWHKSAKHRLTTFIIHVSSTGTQSQVVHKIFISSFVQMWWTVLDGKIIYILFFLSECMFVCEYKCITLTTNCDRFHSFWSIFIQFSRLTVDLLLIFFIFHLRLSMCACLCDEDTYFYFLTAGNLSFCLHLTALYFRTGSGRRIALHLCQILGACLLHPALVENCSPTAANDAKWASWNLIRIIRMFALWQHVCPLMTVAEIFEYLHVIIWRRTTHHGVLIECHIINSLWWCRHWPPCKDIKLKKETSVIVGILLLQSQQNAHQRLSFHWEKWDLFLSA